MCHVPGEHFTLGALNLDVINLGRSGMEEFSPIFLLELLDPYSIIKLKLASLQKSTIKNLFRNESYKDNNLANSNF